MAYISFQPSDFFSSKLYTGTGAELAISSVDFQPGTVWLKVYNTTGHQQVFDSVRGATKVIYPSQTDPEGTVAESLKSFDSDGFTLGTGSYVNTDTNSYVSYNWKTGTTTGIAGSPDITPTAYSFNATSGFSVIQYTGNGANSTLPHGLGKKPGMILIKRTDSAVDWQVYHQGAGATKYGILNTSAAFATNSGAWNNTEPTSTLFTIGTNGECNTNTGTYIAYCFADVKGYTNFGVYEGNGNVNGPFIYTGFRPAWLMPMNVDSAGSDKYIFDDKRLGYNPDNNNLFCNSTSAQGTDDRIDFLSNGFKVRNAGNPNNTDTWCYAAFAEFPTVSSNDIPGVAR